VDFFGGTGFGASNISGGYLTLSDIAAQTVGFFFSKSSNLFNNEKTQPSTDIIDAL